MRHQVRALKEIDARVDREPEFTLFRHRAAADAQHLRVLRCDALKNRKRRQRRQRARRVTVVGRDGKTFFKNALHAVLL